MNVYFHNGSPSLQKLLVILALALVAFGIYVEHKFGLL